jgi:hypothetical protein
MPAVINDQHEFGHAVSPIVFEGRMPPLNMATFIQK